MSDPGQKISKKGTIKLCEEPNISKAHPKENRSINGKIALLEVGPHRKYGFGITGICHKSVQNLKFKILRLTSNRRLDESLLVLYDGESTHK